MTYDEAVENSFARGEVVDGYAQRPNPWQPVRFCLDENKRVLVVGVHGMFHSHLPPQANEKAAIYALRGDSHYRAVFAIKLFHPEMRTEKGEPK